MIKHACVLCGRRNLTSDVTDTCDGCLESRRAGLVERLRLAEADYTGPPAEPIPAPCATGAVPGHRNAGEAESIEEMRRISSDVRVSR